MRSFLPQRLPLAQAGAQTVACGDAAQSQKVKNTQQMSGNTSPSKRLSPATTYRHVKKCTVTRLLPSKERAHFLADLAVTAKESQ